MFTLALLLAVAASPVSAQSVYKCTDAKGATTYQSAPCAAGKESRVPIIDNGVGGGAMNDAAAEARRQENLRYYREELARRDAQEKLDRAYRIDAAAAQSNAPRTPAPMTTQQREAAERAKRIDEHRAMYGQFTGTPAQQREARAVAAAKAGIALPTETDEATSRARSVPIPSASLPNESEQRKAKRAYCNEARCNDEIGNAYTPKPGLINRYTSPDGRSCYRSGNTMSCL